MLRQRTKAIFHAVAVLTNREVIFHLGRARRGPGGVHRGDAFGVGTSQAAQTDDAVRDVDLDAIGVNQGAAPQGLLQQGLVLA